MYALVVLLSLLTGVLSTTTTSSSTKTCPCTFTSYVPINTTSTINYFVYTASTATDPSGTATSTLTTTTSICTSTSLQTLFGNYLTRSTTLTVHVPSVTTTTVCTGVSTPAGYTSRQPYCKCPNTKTTTSTYTSDFTTTLTTTFYTTTVQGPYKTTVTEAVTTSGSCVTTGYGPSVTDVTYTKTVYKKTKTETLGPAKTPSHFHLMAEPRGDNVYGVGAYEAAYLYELDFLLYGSVPDECWAWNGTSQNLATYHFTNHTNLVLGKNGTCTDYSQCANGSFSQPEYGSVPLVCFIDCGDQLRCTTGTFGAGNLYDEPCVDFWVLGDPVQDPPVLLDVLVVPAS